MALNRRPSASRGHLVEAAYQSLRRQWLCAQLGDAVDADRRVDEAFARLTVEEAAFVRALEADELAESGPLVEIITRRYGPYDHGWSPCDEDPSPPLRSVPIPNPKGTPKNENP